MRVILNDGRRNIADHGIIVVRSVGAGQHPLQTIVRRHQRLVGGDGDLHVEALFQRQHAGALLVEQVDRHRGRHIGQDLSRPAANAFLLDRPQDVQGGTFDGAHDAGAFTVHAYFGAGLQQAGPQALTRHLQQSKGADTADLDAGAVGFQFFLDAPLDVAGVARFVHVDEIDDDQTGQVTQAELAGNLFGGLQVGAVGGFLDVAFFGRTARVDVDGDQRFGRVDDDIAARFQLHRRAVHRVELLLDLVAVKQRDAVDIGLNALGMRRHQHFHEILGGAVSGVALHQDFVDFLGIKIPDRAFDQIGLFIGQGGRCRAQRQLAHAVPEPQQVFVIAFDFGLAPLLTGGAHDQPHALGHGEIVNDRLEFLAVGLAGDLTTDAAAARRVGHQDAVAPGQRQISRQRSTLVAAFFLDHLDQQDLPAFDDFLDFVAPVGTAASLHDLVQFVATDRFDVLAARLARFVVVIVGGANFADVAVFGILGGNLG